MTCDELARALLAPFRLDEVETREGPRKRLLAYAATEVVLRRIIETCPNHSWKVNSMELVSRGDQPACWLCHGTLTVDGLGARDGIGTATAMTSDGQLDVEAPKSAETDAYKRAAVKFGVALHLYSRTDPIRIGAVKRDSNNVQTGHRPDQPSIQATPAQTHHKEEPGNEGCTCPPGLRMLKGVCQCCGAGHMEYHRCKRQG